MSLPLKYKLGLRVHWDPPSCPAAKALQDLRDALGVIVRCDPEWPIIVSELRDIYEKEGTDLLASIAGLIRGLCEAIAELADDETWSDALWTKLGEGGPRTLCIFPEVSAQPLTKPLASWDDQRDGIILAIPKKPITAPLEFIPSMKEELLRAFDPKEPSAQWVELDAGNDATTPIEPLRNLSLQNASNCAQPRVQYLPDFASIPRPDELLQSVPYHMIVRDRGEVRIDIECTHSPSLNVLADYLKRWCRTNHNLSTKPPVVDVRLKPGSFGAGLVHDVLTLQAADKSQAHVSSTLILHLVESVLGYERVHTDAFSWQFRRDTPLKML